MLRACVTGIACLAFLCGGFWVLDNGTRRRRVKEREDRISQLPDDVISLIVSRLHTTDAVRTSVLSRRWKHVYTFISEVRFFCHRISADSPPCRTLEGEKLSEFQRKFVQAVDTFLQHHSGSKIMSFVVVCCFGGYILDSFRRWMNYVSSRLGVERIFIVHWCPKHMLNSNPPVFSSDFLPEESLVKSIYLLGGSFQISSQKALKNLELNYVTLTSEAVECILLNCCSLQSLKLKFCILPAKLHIHGPDLQLKSLIVFKCSKVAEIDLSAINLTTLELYTVRMLTLSFGNVPLLQNLLVYIFYYKVSHYVIGKVARDLPHLKSMHFLTDARFFEEFELGGVNKLSHLRQLDLYLYHHNNIDLLASAAILDVCPLLRKFHLSMILPSTSSNGKRAVKRVVRLHTQLKEVVISGFRGTENEYDFIWYILKNVVFLERLSICLDVRCYHINYERWMHINRNRMDDKKKRRIIRQRLQGHIISKNVEISIV